MKKENEMYETEKLKKGQKFNHLTYTGESRRIGRRRYGTFDCDCGATKEIRTDQVIRLSTTSCGCAHRNQVGLSSSNYEKLFGVWQNMKNRCYNEKSERYYAYGARGIRVCDEWKSNFKVFAKWAVENGWKPSLSIERKDLEIGYCPYNCTFITMSEQARNKTSNIRVVIDGADKCVAEWCRIFGLRDKTIYKRYSDGIREPKKLFYNGDLRSCQ